MTDASNPQWLSFVPAQLVPFAASVVVLRQHGWPVVRMEFVRLRLRYDPDLHVAALGLLPLDRLEQCFEVALAEPLRAVPLDQLEEHRRPVLDRLVKTCSR